MHAFFGNLRNGVHFEGFWGCVRDDNTVWWGARNGITFGRFDVNNPQLLGPKLESERFYIVAGRMAAGAGKVKLDLFVNDATAVAAGEIEARPDANPSKLAIGQERDATNHPGRESFDGAIARFLIFNRPLDDKELETRIRALRKYYSVSP